MKDKMKELDDVIKEEKSCNVIVCIQGGFDINDGIIVSHHEGKFPYYLDTEDVWGADDLLDKYEDLKFSD